jgi:hypothetical protein
MRGGRHLVKCWNGCDYKEIFIALFAQGLLQGDDEDHLRDERRRSNDEAEERRQREEIEQLRRGICRARVLYRSTVPGAGTIVEIYWQSRGLAGPLPPVLRFAQYYKHRNPEYGYLPAMVAPVVNVYGQQTGVAATFLRPDGSGKADLPKRDQRQFNGPISGGAVRLASHDPRHELIVSTGLETTASAMAIFRLPGWAALADSGIRDLDLPAEVLAVAIAADNDESGSGQEAALFAYEKWTGEGRSVRLLVPPNVGEDFNHILLSWRQ